LRDDPPDPTAADAGSRPVGLWLKGFAAFRAKGLGKGRKVGSAEGSKPFLCVHCGFGNEFSRKATGKAGDLSLADAELAGKGADWNWVACLKEGTDGFLKGETIRAIHVR
jgi:hypothetical protein